MDVDVVSRRIVVASARLLQSKKCRSDYCKEEMKVICLCFVFLVHDCDETLMQLGLLHVHKLVLLQPDFKK